MSYLKEGCCTLDPTSLNKTWYVSSTSYFRKLRPAQAPSSALEECKEEEDASWFLVRVTNPWDSPLLPNNGRALLHQCAFTTEAIYFEAGRRKNTTIVLLLRNWLVTESQILSGAAYVSCCMKFTENVRGLWMCSENVEVRLGVRHFKCLSADIVALSLYWL